MKKKILISMITIGVISVFLGFTSISKAGVKTDDSKEVRTLTEEEMKQAQELNKKKVEEEKNVENIVLEEVGSYKDNVGFYYYNLNTEAEYSLNPDKEFRAASTIKLPQAMMILDDIHAGKLTFDTMLKYDEKIDYEGGTGSLQYRKNLNTISVGEAVKLSITVSDNIAYKMLKRNSSMQVSDYIEMKTGIKIEGNNHLTARQAMVLLKVLYENPNNNPYYETLLGYLKNTVFHDSFDKYIPHEDIAHKIGSYYRYYHDIGVIYSNEDYILVMYTKDIGELPKTANLEDDEVMLTDEGEFVKEIQAKISKRIYELHNKEEIDADIHEVDNEEKNKDIEENNK